MTQPTRLRYLPRCPCLVGMAVLSFIVSSHYAFAQKVKDTAADSATMLIMAPHGPVFADVQISVDGEAYRLWVTRFLADKTDVNRDGQLTLEELELIPERLRQQIQARSPIRVLRKSAGSKTAESVSVDRFTTWMAGELNVSFNVIAGAVQASEAVRLAALVDQNGDGSVSRMELMAGSHAMRFRDLDDDQTFSAAELLPYRDPRNQQAAIIPDVANLPFVQLTDEDSIRRATEQLQNRYGESGDVPVAKLRFPDGTAADTNADGQLNATECAALLRAPTFHLEISFLLSDKANRSKLTFNISEHAAAFLAVSDIARAGRARLIVDDMPIEVRARGGSQQARSYLLSFLGQYFSVNDSDRSGYLSEDEFPGMQQMLAQKQLAAEFSDMDLNGDGMLFRDELKMYIERGAIATQSQIEVSVRQDGKTLFKLLDANLDRRLSQREMLQGFDGLLEYDIDGDQQLTESELGTAYALEIGLGQPDDRRMGNMIQSMNMAGRSSDAILPGVSGLNGPEWFRRMDRNQDRDVSFREFLGPRLMFDDLDTDRDGLLSADEAAALIADNTDQ